MKEKTNAVAKLKRVFEVHKLLRGGNSYSASEIAEHFEKLGILSNARMVAVDIATLRQFGAEVSGHKFLGYAYKKPFSLLQSLEGIEVANFNEIFSYLHQHGANRSEKDTYNRILISFEQLVRNPDLEGNTNIQFEKAELRNIEYLDSIYKHVVEKRVLDLRYQIFGQEPVLITVMPVLLKQYNNRWALVAYNFAEGAYRNYSLDRIVSFKFSTKVVKADGTFSADEYFQNVIGYTVLEGEPQLITFTILKPRSYYVETKKWHKSQQKVEETAKEMTFQICIIPNREFWAKVFEHVEDIKIVGPDHIKNEFENRLGKVSERLKMH
jgi:predicted DNA-binding transcriptional regulator YafY